MGDGGAEGRRERLERAAGLRAARGAPTPEEAEELEREEQLNRKRREIDTARRADYLIREAMARGDFDHLEYAGKPIPGLDNVSDPDWWLKGLIQREQLTGLGPEALRLRVEAEHLEDTLDALPGETAVREALESFNRRIIEARRQLLGGPPVVTRLRDIESDVAAWHERRGAAVAARAEAEKHDAGTRPPSFWRRWVRGRGA